MKTSLTTSLTKDNEGPRATFTRSGQMSINRFYTFRYFTVFPLSYFIWPIQSQPNISTILSMLLFKGKEYSLDET